MKKVILFLHNVLSFRNYAVTFLFLLCIGSIYLSFPIKIQAEPLVIYTTRSQVSSEQIFKQFTQKTGITVRPFYMLASDILKALKERPNSPVFDVLWGCSLPILEENDKFFQEYESPTKNFINSDFIDIDNKWYATSLQLGVLAINPTLLPEKDAPTSWKQICDTNKKQFIVAGSPETTSYIFNSLYAISCIIDDFKIKQFIGKFKFVNDNKLVSRGIASGLFNIGFAVEASLLGQKQRVPNQVQIIYPSDGVVALPEGTALIRNAPHPKEAQQFLEFLLSKEGQIALQQFTLRRSVRTDVLPLDFMPDISSLHIIYGFLPHHHMDANNQDKMKQWRNFLNQR